MDRSRSESLFARAQQLMPGGVNSPARAFGAVGGTPIIVERADGSSLYDVDGNRYIDYIGSWGPMILGHRHPAVLEALESALARGTSFGAPTPGENELAELIIEAVASVEKVRLVNSGTEATMSAVRLARGYTNRDVIVKFAGNYHGHVDSLLVAAGSSAATLGVPNSPGVTAGTTQDTLVLEFNDCQGLEEAFAAHGHRDGFAGVLDRQAPRESIRCVHRDAADGVFTEVHRNFNDQVVFLVVDEGVAHGESGVDVRELSGWKFHIHYGSSDLDDLAGNV